MPHIGFSHGVAHRLREVYSAENLRLLAAARADALEVNLHHVADLPRLAALRPHLGLFSRVSLHLPCDCRYGDDAATRALLAAATAFAADVGAQVVVVHPDLVDDWGVFDDFPAPWAVENMDDRKAGFRTPEDFQAFFAAHGAWRLVLDLAHCKVNDPTMALADGFIAAFRDLIVEVHLSGYVQFHEPLSRTRQDDVIRRAAVLAVPVILESTFDVTDGLDAVGQELAYVRARMALPVEA